MASDVPQLRAKDVTQHLRTSKFLYKGTTTSILFSEKQEPSAVIEKVRRSFCIGNDKLVYLLDSKREVHDELPKNEEVYTVKVEPEEFGGFTQFFETFRCCTMQPVGWEHHE
mmetsp:Transcript_13956/g.33123  ORF Transcript_13956/g.33123 Transcript_13956/m.33123 type:complete len:112 (+) Transcript_13956:228-563(+)